MANRRFDTTHWSIVSAARGADTEAAARAMAALCEAYWYPIYAHVRRSGRSPEDAEDLTQAFVAQLLELKGFQRADREKGRLRSFLLRSLDNFLATDARNRRRQKRGGGVAPLSIDFTTGDSQYTREPADPDTPDVVFDRRWARAVVGRAITMLAEAARSRGRQREFATLAPALTGDATRGDYAAWAQALDVTASAVKVAVHRLRRRFEACVREVIGETLERPDPRAIDDELSYLQSVLRDAGAAGRRSRP